MDIKANMKNTINQLINQPINENETQTTDKVDPVVGLISLGVSVSKYFDAKKK